MLSEEALEHKRQLERDRRAAKKFFWQNLVAHKDGFDLICCVECGLPETDLHNPLHYSHNDPATKSFDLSVAIMTGALHKTHAEIEAAAQKCSLRHLRCHSTFADERNNLQRRCRDSANIINMLFRIE
jgi:hypothetical protein